MVCCTASGVPNSIWRMLFSEKSCGGSGGSESFVLEADLVALVLWSAAGVRVCEGVDAAASEVRVIVMESLVSLLKVDRRKPELKALSYAGKCGAGAVAKVSCTVAGITGVYSLSVVIG